MNERLKMIMDEYCNWQKDFEEKHKDMPKPLYERGDTVRFNSSRGEKIGTIEIVDRYGTFEQNEEPSYDILIEEENMLYKHIRQSWIIGKEVANEDSKE